ncbi:MAG: M48 family metalloprotease [Phycisphaerae bacterium]|nr:M48 family metalloprotease [Phycisphaerae bacterium]
MIHVLIILLLAIVAARDGVDSLPILQNLSPAAVALWTLLPMASISVLLQLFTMWCGRRLDRSGRWLWVHLAEGALASSRFIAVLFHAIAILVLGWLDLVRQLTGSRLILIDEAIATLPALLVFALGWATYYPIDRRLREASILRRLDTTGQMPNMPTRWEYTWEQTRHNLLIVLAPITLILAWTDITDAAIDRFAQTFDAADPRWLSNAATALHLLGVLLVLLCVPYLLKLIWSTIPLGPGELRSRLLALCRTQGVRCRDLLVWRTHTNMVNGAVVGMLPAARYILLTDTLLDQLPARQVEAVMAHEVAHARRHHLPWLIAMMFVTVTLVWVVAATAAESVLPDAWRTIEQPSPIATNFGLIAALIIAIIVFGWVSRRFEEQADAFAAQHLSGASFGPAPPHAPDSVIQPEAASTMAAALDAVCNLNHLPPERFTFRHGSIAQRQRRLLKLIGRPINRLPIDRLVALIKIIVLAGLLLIAALWMWSA